MMSDYVLALNTRRFIGGLVLKRKSLLNKNNFVFSSKLDSVKRFNSYNDAFDYIENNKPLIGLVLPTQIKDLIFTNNSKKLDEKLTK